MALRPCPQCSRHIRQDACPFCGANQHPTARPPAWVLAVGLALSMANTSCGGTTEEDPDFGGLSYAAPMSDSFEVTGPTTSPTDSDTGTTGTGTDTGTSTGTSTTTSSGTDTGTGTDTDADTDTDTDTGTT